MTTESAVGDWWWWAVEGRESSTVLHYCYGTLLIIIEGGTSKAQETHLTSPYLHDNFILSNTTIIEAPSHLLQELYESIPHATLMRPSPANSPPLP